MSAQSTALVYRFQAILSSDTWQDRLDEVLDPAILEPFRASHQDFRRSVSKYSITCHDIVATDAQVATFVTVAVKHTGEWFGRTGNGAPISFDCMNLYDIRGGKIAGIKEVGDDYSVLVQLGLMPPYQ